MPKKNNMSSPVYDMPHERQVECLSEALLREYMHRRKYTETLRVFDEENPRDGDTISSRALMSDLMGLKPEVQKEMKDEGIETIMEMLCCLRVKRRLILEELKRQASAEIPSIPEESVDSSKKDKLNRKEKKEKKTKKSSSKKSIHSATPHAGGSGHTNSCDESSDKNSSVVRSNSIDGCNTSGARWNEQETDSWLNGKSEHVLGKERAREVMEVLVGPGSCVPLSFVKQGFAYDGRVEYGLSLSKSSGLESFLVVVQAFVCALFFRGGFIDVESHQRQCLVSTLAAILRGAESNVHHVCILDGSFENNCTLADFMRLTVHRNFKAPEEVEERLNSVLEHWMEPNGPGVFCFLLSVIVSRGPKVVVSNVGQVIDKTAVCSAAFTEFLLRDPLPSDDVLSLLEDNAGQTACGFTSSTIETRENAINREKAVSPRYPVWVVHCNERFVVLFLKADIHRDFEQSKKMGIFTSADLFLYEITAERRDELFLTISTRSSSRSRKDEENSSSRLADSIRTIPVWSGGDIDWNGMNPPF